MPKWYEQNMAQGHNRSRYNVMEKMMTFGMLQRENISKFCRFANVIHILNLLF